jgi:hypothetical protein
MRFTALFHFTSASQVPVLYCTKDGYCTSAIQRASIDEMVSVKLSHYQLIPLESPYLDIALYTSKEQRECSK